MAAIAALIRLQSKPLGFRPHPAAGWPDLDRPVGELVATREDLRTSPGIVARQRMVQLQVAAAVDLPLAFERVVAERAVKGGQGQVAESVHEVPVDLVRILAKAGKVLAPVLAERLRQDVLDRQVADLKSICSG